MLFSSFFLKEKKELDIEYLHNCKPLYPETSPNFYIPLITQLKYEGLIII